MEITIDLDEILANLDLDALAERVEDKLDTRSLADEVEALSDRIDDMEGMLRAIHEAITI